MAKVMLLASYAQAEEKHNITTDIILQLDKYEICRHTNLTQ